MEDTIIHQTDIPAWRFNRNMSQVQLAAFLGFSPPMLCAIELGHKNITRKAIKDMFEMFGITIIPRTPFKKKEYSRPDN